MHIYLRKHLVWVQFLTVPCCAFSQVNLVPNYSFEEYSNCPFNIYDFTYLNDWQTLYYTPDFYNECSNGTAGIPTNYNGFQEAHSGNGYSGIITYRNTSPPLQEYFFVSLSNPLEAGTKYRVRASFSIADSSGISACCVGLLFSNSAPPMPPYNSNISSVELVLSESDMLDFNTWHSLDTLYTALGGENKLFIGNFRPLWASSTITTNNDNPFCYMYIDDVEVYEDSLVTARPENIEKETIIGYEAGAETLNVCTSGKADLRLMEVTGKVMLVQQLEKGRNTVSIAGLPNGVYVARVAYAGGQVVCKRVVVGW